ncbi:MAG: hypothetical protein K0S14_238 [Thermomicrobiales bacterium]|jgi:hypothetical protein|nr:hypothetical protein [Thermomicrobiales bacterium]
MAKKAEPDERLARLTASAEAALAAVDAAPMGFEGTVRMYVTPKGRKYITLVGVTNGRPFAEVFGAVADAPDWGSTINALVEREAK